MSQVLCRIYVLNDLESIMNKITAAFVLLGLLSIAVHGDDAEDGFAAYNKKEYKNAFALFNKACDSGAADGCLMVGAIYEDGIIVENNNKFALANYSKACDIGNETACENYKKLQSNLPVCTEEELSFINDKRYFKVSSNKSYSSILADSKTITIDQKNKIIKVWTVWLYSPYGQQNATEEYGSKYSACGYIRRLDIINYTSMMTRGEASAEYRCDGTIVESNTLENSKWSKIIPESVIDAISNNILKKYNLK